MMMDSKCEIGFMFVPFPLQIVQQVPEETCTITPQRSCNEVTKV